MAIDLILGTAGHIDHGKTALVRALTGQDTDRLPEEKRRGITIELGFAHLELGDYRLGIVDVPGHERFVRQMLAGATGMDLAMLIVAADDSVKPQTREHVEVLRMLDICGGVIVLTKCDLAEDDWMELVEAEVRELVEGTFLQDAPIVRTSAITGEGIDELKAVLVQAAEQAAAGLDESVINAPFRMPIDRTFTMTGHGTVVTGSVVSGQAAVGDELTIQPGGIEVRVRGIQNHDQPVERVQRGQRAAINLAGIHHEEIHRGHELAAQGHLVPSQLVTAELNLLTSAPRPLKHRDHVRVHIGTSEILATVALLNQSQMGRGETAYAQLFLREPVAAIWRQPLVLRCESPVETIGGGHVLVPVAEKIRRISAQQLGRLAELKSKDVIARAAAALYFHGTRPWSPADLLRLAGTANGTEVAHQLEVAGRIVSLEISPRRTERIERGVIDEWAERFQASLARAHAAEPLRSFFDQSQLLRRYQYVDDEPLLQAILDAVCATGAIRRSERGVALKDHKLELSSKQQLALQTIIERYREGGFQPPSVADCYSVLPKQQKEVAKLIDLAVADRQLVHIGHDMFLHADHAERIQSLLRESLSNGAGMTLSEIRELLGTTRKYAVPFCEYLDRIGFTKRKGDVRVLA